MKKTLIAIALALMSCVTVKAQNLPENVNKSVVLLYNQDEEGGMRMRCTATAYRVLTHDGGTFTRFVSAAHCVEGDDTKTQKLQKYFITTDTEGTKTFIPAVLIMAGDKKVGDDFSIFEVAGNQFAITPVGDSSKLSLGEQVIDVSSPLGLGKEFYQGYVSNLHLDRPPLDAGEVQWTNVMIVHIGGGPGSSGSAIVSEKQKAIVGFLVGSFGGGDVGMICVPVDKFKAFESAVDKGTYKKTKSDKKDDDES